MKSPIEKLISTWNKTLIMYSIVDSSLDIFRIPMNLQQVSHPDETEAWAKSQSLAIG